jgi:hypothetical protein
VLLDVGLVKLFKGEYASTIIMTIMKNIFWQLNYTSHVWGLLFGEQRNPLGKYAMPLLKEIFDAFG